MMSLLRAVLLLVALTMGAMIGLVFTPLAWVAPQVAAMTHGAARLDAANGTLLRGGGLLTVQELGLRTPVSWRAPVGFGAQINIGGGDVHLTRNAVHTLSDVRLALDHSYGRAQIVIKKDSQLKREPNAVVAQGTVEAPQAMLSVPAAAQLDAIELMIKPDGTWSARAAGDATLTGSGTLTSILPPRGQARVELTPNARNAALGSLIRRNVPVDANGRHIFQRNF